MLEKIKNFLYLNYFKLKYTPEQIARKNGVSIGRGCRIFGVDFGSEPWLVSIGDNVTITSGVKILTHDGATWLIRDEKGRRYLYKPVVIKNNVFIGMNSIIMPGVLIEDNVIIAAGSIVVKSVPTGSVVGGNPAKIIGSFDNYREKAITTFVSDAELDQSLPYMAKVNNLLDPVPKPFLEK